MCWQGEYETSSKAELLVLKTLLGITTKLNILQYKINKTYTIIKQTTSTIAEPCTL